MAQQTFTLDDLKGILTDRIGLNQGDVEVDPVTAFADLGLDSLAMTELQLEIEQRFGFQVADADAADITTLQGAVDYTNRRLQEVSQ